MFVKVYSGITDESKMGTEKNSISIPRSKPKLKKRSKQLGRSCIWRRKRSRSRKRERRSCRLEKFVSWIFHWGVLVVLFSAVVSSISRTVFVCVCVVNAWRETQCISVHACLCLRISWWRVWYVCNAYLCNAMTSSHAMYCRDLDEMYDNVFQHVIVWVTESLQLCICTLWILYYGSIQCPAT